MKEPIVVYRFEDAPENLQKLSDNGGDEDWLAIVPPHLKDAWLGWMDEGSEFGCYKVQKINHPDLEGYEIRIGSHS
jgi:hypothetical protein